MASSPKPLPPLGVHPVQFQHVVGLTAAMDLERGGRLSSDAADIVTDRRLNDHSQRERAVGRDHPEAECRDRLRSWAGAMGGIVALCLAQRHPELVRGLVLQEAPLYARQNGPYV